MKKGTSRLNELLTRYLENRCSREEYEELIQLANKPGHEEEMKVISQEMWDRQSTNYSNEAKPLNGRSQSQAGMKFLKIAAAVAVLVVASYLLVPWIPRNDAIVYTTGNGEVKEIVLPDGSKASLNANSTLTWIPTRSKKKDRIVELSGEAYFNVVKSPLSASSQNHFRGFQVKTPKMTIHVLGTSFNVFARQQNTEVFLEEGSVQLQMPDKNEITEKLEPGDKITLDNKTGHLEKKEAEKISTSASWINGILNFEDKPMGHVLQNLSEIFGVEIVCKDQALNSKKINLGVPYMDWENTKRALEMAINVEFLKEDGSYSVIQK